MQIIRAASCRTTAWKNGGGSTTSTNSTACSRTNKARTPDSTCRAWAQTGADPAGSSQRRATVSRALRTAPLERILIRDREQVHVIAIDEVECIEAQGDYLAIHAGGKCHLKPQRISEIEEQLDATRFGPSVGLDV